MRNLLLATAAVLAAAAIPAFPAQAQSSGSATFVGVNTGGGSVRVHHGFTGRFDGRNDRRRDGRFNDDGVIGSWYDGGEWALYNNRTWESDSYNDWWHDRPDRAYPRWVSTNANCERMWWSGSGWRC